MAIEALKYFAAEEVNSRRREAGFPTRQLGLHMGSHLSQKSQLLPTLCLPRVVLIPRPSLVKGHFW